MTKQILIIDTNTSELRRLREVLTREGYDIMTAVDWETARRISSRIEVDLLLCEFSQLENIHLDK